MSRRLIILLTVLFVLVCIACPTVYKAAWISIIVTAGLMGCVGGLLEDEEDFRSA